jgi:hypothetical protein
MGNVSPHERDARASGYDRSALLHYDAWQLNPKTYEQRLPDGCHRFASAYPELV